MGDELSELRTDLFSGRPKRWPRTGATAVRDHKILVSEILRTAKLAATGDGDGKAWVAYVTEHYPQARNSETDARLLWKDWRMALLKTGSPGPGVWRHAPPAGGPLAAR